VRLCAARHVAKLEQRPIYCGAKAAASIAAFRSGGTMVQTLTKKPGTKVDFEAIFDGLPTPLLLMDRDFNIAALNQAFLDSTKLTRESLIGKDVFTAFPAGQESRRLLQESFERTRDQGVVDVLPLVSYAHEVNGHREERLWSCTHLPVRDRNGRVAYLVKSAQDITELYPSLKAGEELCPPLQEAMEHGASLEGWTVLEGAAHREVLNQTLMATVQHLRRLVMQAPSFMCVLRGPDLVFELVNTAFSMLTGGRELIGKTLLEGLPELKSQELLDILKKTFDSGEVHVARKARLVVRDGEDGESDEHFVDFVAQPIVCAKSGVTGIFIEGNDVTDHVRTQEQQALLIRELHHRVKNTLAAVQGILTTSANTAETFEEFQKGFSARIAALAKMHALMSEQLDQQISFGHLLTQELGPYSDEHGLRIRLSGPSIDLPSHIAVPLGMAVHELAANAVRHGALASEEGRIEVGWSLAERGGKPELICEWKEFAGRAVPPPCRDGFGSLLLNRVLAQQIGADVKVEFAPDGFRLRMAVPLQL